MPLFLTRFEDINKDAIDTLVRTGAREDRHLDYKQDLPGQAAVFSDQKKAEFLADVAAFANAGGGDVVFGVEEAKDANGVATGMPAGALGLRNLNLDATSRRLQEIIDNGLDPRGPVGSCPRPCRPKGRTK